MSTDGSNDDCEAYQCLSGTPIVSSKNKNKYLIENKNKKEPAKFKKVSDVTAPSIAYYPAPKIDQGNGQDNNFLATQGSENGEHQTDSENGVVEEQEYIYSTPTPVFGAQQNSPETVQKSSKCPSCVIM